MIYHWMNMDLQTCSKLYMLILKKYCLRSNRWIRSAMIYSRFTKILRLSDQASPKLTAIPIVIETHSTLSKKTYAPNLTILIYRHYFLRSRRISLTDIPKPINHIKDAYSLNLVILAAGGQVAVHDHLADLLREVRGRAGVAQEARGRVAHDHSDDEEAALALVVGHRGNIFTTINLISTWIADHK